MLDFSRHQGFFRLVTIVVLLAMFPTSVSADMLVKSVAPPVDRVAESGAQGSGGTPARSVPPQPLTEAQMREIAGVPSLDAPAREQIRRKLDVPPVKGVVEKVRAARTSGKAATSDKASVLVPSAKPKPLTRTELQKTKGGQDVADMLAEAQRLADNGQYADAALAYLDIQNNYSRTWAAIDAGKGLYDLLLKMMHAEVTPAQQADFAARFPSFEQMQSVEVRTTVISFLNYQALLAKAAGQTESAAQYYGLCRQAAWTTMQQDTDHPIQGVYVVDFYYNASDALGQAAEAAEQLRSLINDLPPCAVSWGARYSLGMHMRKYENDPGSAFLNWVDLLGALQTETVDAILDDPGLADIVKMRVLSDVAYASNSTGDRERALAIYERMISDFPGQGDEAYSGRAVIINALHRDQPALCIEAFTEYLTQCPKGEYADLALYSIGTIYYRCEEYASAADILREVILQYPNSRGAQAAESLLDFMIRWELVAPSDESEPAEDPKPLAMCGPYALQRLLAMEGVNTTADELVTLAGTTETGTSMYGLVQAAAQKGVALKGVQATDVAQLEPPFIAFVNGNHFVLVQKSLDAKMLMVSSMDKRETPVPVSEFASTWDGKALVLRHDIAMAEMAQDTLMATRGGCPEWPDGTPSDSPANDPPVTSHNVAMLAPTPSMPAGDITVHGYQSSQMCGEADLSLNEGDTTVIEFGRNFFNRWGLFRTEIVGNLPWQNNIGRDWSHTYSVRVVTSYSTIPQNQ